ncbi:MAG: type II toxin-antitoxin system prevent-host-death family antitoxin, partial [Microgenomates group bacterium]
GENVIIARAGKPVVKLALYTPSQKPRAPGKLKGKVWVSPDFDDESKEIEALFYNGPVEP